MAARAVPAGGPAIANAILGRLFGANHADQGVAPLAPHPLSVNIDNLIANWGVTVSTTGIVKAAYIIAMYKLNGNPYPIDGLINADITMTTSPVAGAVLIAVVGTSANVAAIEDNANGNFLRQVIASVDAARTWLEDISAAEQTRKLTPKNIEGYFMSKGNTKIVGREMTMVVDLFARGLPRLMADIGGRAILMNDAGDWIKYHTSATSTANLVHRSKEAIIAAFPNMFTGATIGAIDAAHAATWDKGLADDIPKMAVAVSYIWLKAAKQLPDDWFQGEKAYGSMNAAIAKSFANLFRRYLAIVSDETAINALVNVGALAAYQATAPGLFGI